MPRSPGPGTTGAASRHGQNAGDRQGAGAAAQNQVYWAFAVLRVQGQDGGGDIRWGRMRARLWFGAAVLKTRPAVSTVPADPPMCAGLRDAHLLGHMGNWGAGQHAFDKDLFAGRG